MTSAGDLPLDGLRQIALAVAVIAARDGTSRSCCTGTLSYVSVEPAMVATALTPASRTLATLRASRAFSITLLGRDLHELAGRAGAPAVGHDKFAELGIPVREGPDGRVAPAVEGALAVLWCTLVDDLPTGDHVCCIGRVDAVLAGREPSAGPLVRFRRGYFPLDLSNGTADTSAQPI